MSETPSLSVMVNLRIPGDWANAQELFEQVPDGFLLTTNELIYPPNDDGTPGLRFEIEMRDVDDEFVGIFAQSCRREPTEEEKSVVENHTVQLCLSGECGSIDSARQLMEAACVLLDAGGAGVFIDNSGVAFGASKWKELTEDGSPDALSFAYVGIIRGKERAFTLGLHILGLRDIRMRNEDLSEDGSEVIETIQYICTTDKPIDEGHVLADLNGPRFRVKVVEDTETPDDSPMHNPFGRFSLTSFKEIAERN